MVQGQDFNVSFTYNNKDFNVDARIYGGMNVHEILHHGIYFVELILLNTGSIFRDYPIMTGIEMDITIKLLNTTQDTLTMQCVVYDKDEQKNKTIIVLIPKIFATSLGKDKISKGYKDKFDNIVSQIASSVGITNTEIESTTLLPRLYLQLNQTNFNFIKTNLKYMKNNNANFIFYIDKTGKLKCYSMGHLKTKLPVMQMADNYVDNLTIKDLSFSSQLMSGLGGTGWYFSWDNGDFENVVYDEAKFSGISSSDKMNDKIGININYINENAKIMMLNPVAQNITPMLDYNEAELENEMLRKNYFNVFVSFDCSGNLKCSPGELMDMRFTSTLSFGKNKTYSGKWFIYSVVHKFSLSSYAMNVTLSSSFINSVVEPNFI